MSEVLLAANDLLLGYRRRRRVERQVAERLDVEVEAGELVCLLGPNGSGKSTLLRTLAGMQEPLGGRVELLGQPIDELSPAALARRLSIVLTERVSVGSLTARSLVGLGRYPHTDWMGRLSAEDWQRVDAALEMLTATDLAERRVDELSDGERQKVLVARALAQEPRLMILDEPTSFLDLPRRIEMLALLRRLTRSSGCSVLLATHHLDLALHYADRLWLLSAEGELHTGAPEDLALGGELGATFSGEGLRFDRERGEFRFDERPHGHRLDVVGEGLALVWTVHAMRRLGFEVVSGGDSEGEVRVGESGDGHLWSWRWRAESGSSDSISGLVRGLRAVGDNVGH